MQAKISPVKSILKALRYNEQKVAQGKAERIHAENFLKDHDRLTKADILERFRQRSTFNERMKDNGIHISLNYGKNEQLGNEKLIRLIDRYAEAMNLGDQPYVAYKHNDAGHTHVHIVATSVKANGDRIDLHPRDYLNSVLLCKQLEKEFSLEKLIGATDEQKEEFSVDHAQKVIYGEPGLKRAISDVLNTVVDHYNYTSLNELNAILRQYNVTANPGEEGSRLNKVGGLLYQAIDSDGARIGVPIKASLFLLKPTLKNLEQRFTQNQTQRETHRERLSTAIEWALAGRTPTWERLREDLEKKGINIVINNGKDDIRRVFFVDHLEKYAFEGKNLGPGYTLEDLRTRCTPEERVTDEITLKNNQKLHV
jgi:hypothetical protein